MNAWHRTGSAAIGDLRRTWTHAFLLSFVTRVVLAVLLLPGLAIVLRLALASRGRAALSDQEILFFFVSPLGLATLVVLGGAAIGVALLEQAGLQTMALGAVRERRITWYGALRHVLGELGTLLALGGHLLVRLLLLIIPLLLALGAGYLLLLGEHDINYYLSARPPEYVRALWLAGGLTLAWAAFAIPRVIGWVYALPILLLDGVGPSEALRRATEDARGHRWRLAGWISAWFAAGWAVSAAATWLLGMFGRLVVPQTTDSVGLMAVTIGAVGVATIVVNLLISFFSATLMAFLIVRLYDAHRGRLVATGRLPDQGELGSRARFDIDRRDLAWGALGLLVLSAGAAWVLLSSVDMEHEAVVIAHRGAAMHAPENTMASIRAALDAGADFVEIDVQENADGDVIVFHDSDFMKTARNPMRLWEARNADLAELDIGSWFDPAFSGERPPSLEDVLTAARGRAKVNIELKYYGHDEALERKVIDLVERTGMEDDIVVMSLKHDKVQKIRAMRPEWTYGLLTTVDLGDATRYDVDFLAVNARAANRRFVRRVHAAGKEVYVWTVNDPFAMATMLSRGVDGLITDDPATARRVIEARAGLNAAERLLFGIGTEVGAFTIPRPEPDEEDA